jgi:hypothetical protein
VLTLAMLGLLDLGTYGGPCWSPRLQGYVQRDCQNGL